MSRSNNRDEFTPATKKALERQARGHCSNPECRDLTSAATSDGTDEIRVGVASHIEAAAEGGPRYRAEMTTEERRSADNGIWLCQVCGKAVDSKDSKFTVDELRGWKRRSNEDSWRSVMEKIPYGPRMAPTPNDIRRRLEAAAKADLDSMQKMAKWPRSDISPTLMIEGIEAPLTIKALAEAVTTFDDLLLVAPPGMGKTATLFHLARSVSDIGNGIPLVLPLGEWATGTENILGSILKRPAFLHVSESDFRTAADNPGIVLLLDGWNELDALSRQRAGIQIARLKLELPEVGLVVATRQEALDVPLAGKAVEILPLGDEQQINIARALRGADGERLVDQAWRTPGVSDLVAVPLYLTALLDLPPGTAFPRTKEEVLRRFVAAQENDEAHKPSLRAVVDGFQAEYLERLAVVLTDSGNTSLSAPTARQSVAAVTRDLIEAGQLSSAIAQPNDILNALASHHVLVRMADDSGYTFQHQQFQEWFASHSAARLIVEAGSDDIARDHLKRDILDLRPWTEAVLFAIERMSRGDESLKAACGKLILAGFEVDPILAAELIYRATDEVWDIVSCSIKANLDRWHAAGKIDRAVRFMITSGRPEFADILWPLFSHENDHVHLAALSAGSRFRPAVLGPNAEAKIKELPQPIRANVLREIASNSGMDGLDLATKLAKEDIDAEVKATVVSTLDYRRADRHVLEILETADDATYDILVDRLHVGQIHDAAVAERITAARARRAATRTSPRERLYDLVHGEDPAAVEEVTDLVARLDIDRANSAQSALLYDVQQRYPKAFTDALMLRLRSGSDLFYRADDALALAGYIFDDEELLGIALSGTDRVDDRAEAAASVLGPASVGKLIDAYLTARAASRVDGRYDEAATKYASALRSRIAHTPGSSLVAAMLSKADDLPDESIGDLSHLFARDTSDEEGRGRPFSRSDQAKIGDLAEKWGERLLATENISRVQKASIAEMIGRAPSARRLPILKRLLDDNLNLYAGFRERVRQSGRADRDAIQQAQHPFLTEYYRALRAIEGTECDDLVATYLTNVHFGELAAQILRDHWTRATLPKSDKMFFGGVDFSNVVGRRQEKAAQPEFSAAEADRIFDAIDTLTARGLEQDEQKQLALALAAVGTTMPHGERRETIDRLLATAPRRARARLLLSLILSGETIQIGTIETGIADVFEAAKTESWILRDDSYELKEWLRLLPFATPVSEIPKIIANLPEQQRNPRMLEEMTRCLGRTPEPGAEEALFALAENDPAFYADHQWHASALELETLSSARRLIDLTIADKLKRSASDAWRAQRELAALISKHPELRIDVRELLGDGATSAPLLLLARALAENPAVEDIKLLIDAEKTSSRALLDWQSVENATTLTIPSDHWQGAYHRVPLPANELRRGLLALTTDGGATDRAAHCLNEIDKLRDKIGVSEQERRHPDITSGRPWPILAPDPYAEALESYPISINSPETT